MKKQIILTFIVLSCALLVFALSFLPTDTPLQNDDFKMLHGTSLDFSANLPPAQNEVSATISPPAVRIYLFKGLPFELNSVRLISVIQITLILIFISLFIKPRNPKVECIFDSDGKK